MFLALIFGKTVAAIVASTQLYGFAAFGDPLGSLSSQGERFYFLLATASVACISSGLLFYLYYARKKSEWSKVSAAPVGPVFTAVGANPFTDSLTLAQFDPVRWALANPWLSEGQADDRKPMNGTVAASAGTPSAYRASARRSHQASFKKWSQERHD